MNGTGSGRAARSINVRTIPRGQLVAVAAGIALLVSMIGFDWYRVLGAPDGFNAFQAFSLIDVVLLITAIAAIDLVLVAAAIEGRSARIAASALTAGLGILATILVVYRLVAPPELGPGAPFGLEGVEGAPEVAANVRREVGLYLGLLASVAIAYGAARSVGEESRG